MQKPALDSIKHEHLANQISKRIKRQIERMGISKAQLSALSGVPKSTISPILAETDPKLPNLTTLVKISRVINLPPSELVDFQFDWKFSGNEVDRDATFLSPGALSHTSVFRDVLIEITSGEIVYAPTNLPDFVKSERIMDIEMEKLVDRDQYIEALSHLDITKVRGAILLNKLVLEAIMLRKGKYSALHRSERDDVVEKLMQAQNDCPAKFYVVDFFDAAITPILLLQNDLSLTYVNNGYLVSRDPHYSKAFRLKVNELIYRRACATPLYEALRGCSDPKIY